MGCAPSSPQDVDTLPIKAQCRTAFAKCSTMEPANANGFLSDKQLGQQQDAEGHDVVLCYPLGGTVFGLELQARYEKMDSLSLWTLDHFLSLPGSPLQANKSSSVRNGMSHAAPGLEIRPAPEPTGAAASPPNLLLSREVRLCRRGVVVLVTAGCTWDDGVLNCLRLTGRFLRPLVLVHCVQSCPLPALEEWPQDVRPLIAASGPPVKYLTQHSAEALRHVEQRMLAAAAAAAAARAPSAPPTVAVSVGAPASAPVAAASGHWGCMQQALQGIPPQQQQRQQQSQARQSQLHGASVRPAPQPKEQPQSLQQQQAEQQQAAGGQGQQQPGQDVANGAAAAGPGPSLSLEALQSADSAVCRRAAQLLGPWTASGGCSPAAGGPGRVLGAPPSRCESPITTTLVEALIASQRPSSSSLPRNAGARCHPGTRSGTASSSGYASVTGSQKSSRNPSPTPGRNRQQRQRPQTPQQAQCTQRAAGPPSAQTGGGGVRCVLCYRDACWATPVAFVCAQLEEDLGQVNVSLLPAAAAKQPQTQPRQAPAPVTVACAAARLSLQSPDGWGRGRCRRPSQQQPEKRQALDSGGKGGGASPAGAAAAAAAAAAQPSPGRGPGPAARCSSSGSSGRCSATGCRAEVSTTSDLTSMASGGGASSPEPGVANGAAMGDDDLVAFSSPSLDSGASPPMSASVCEARSRAAAAGPSGANRRALGTGTGIGGAGPGPGTPRPDPTSAAPWTAPELEAEANVTCVYFVSPGLSAPLGCLEEISSGLARGRRVVLVVDGECCQRLPDYTPPGVAPHVWKAVKKLWQERLLYVPDYHTSFYGLLKHWLLATAAAPK